MAKGAVFAAAVCALLSAADGLRATVVTGNTLKACADSAIDRVTPNIQACADNFLGAAHAAVPPVLTDRRA